MPDLVPNLESLNLQEVPVHFKLARSFLTKTVYRAGAFPSLTRLTVKVSTEMTYDPDLSLAKIFPDAQVSDHKGAGLTDFTFIVGNCLSVDGTMDNFAHFVQQQHQLELLRVQVQGNEVPSVCEQVVFEAYSSLVLITLPPSLKKLSVAMLDSNAVIAN